MTGGQYVIMARMALFNRLAVVNGDMRNYLREKYPVKQVTRGVNFLFDGKTIKRWLVDEYTVIYEEQDEEYARTQACRYLKPLSKMDDFKIKIERKPNEELQ